MKYKYVCYRCKKEYKYNVGRCTNLVESEDTGGAGNLWLQSKGVKDETTD